MGFTVTGIAAPVALGAIALLGYLVGRRQRRTGWQASATMQKLDQTNAVIRQLEAISQQLRRNLAMHHATVDRCRQQIRQLGERTPAESGGIIHAHFDEVLAPTDRLSQDIASAYEDLRRHTSELTRLRAH